jgi:hypothetical protein
MLERASAKGLNRTLVLGATKLKFRDVVDMVERDGWKLVRTKGSHRQYRHSVKPGTNCHDCWYAEPRRATRDAQ